MKRKFTRIIYMLVGIGLTYLFFQPDKVEFMFSGMLVIVTSVSVIISYMMYNSQTTPKLYVIGKVKEAKNQWDGGIMNEFIASQSEEIEGLAYGGNNKSILLEIHNNGSIPATNIKVEYDIVTYINEIEFGVDKAEIQSYKGVILERVTRTIEYDYLPPGDSRSEVIFFVSRYPQCDIVVKKLVSKEEKFITSNTVVFTYYDNRFKELSDSQDLLYLLGVYNPHLTN